MLRRCSLFVFSTALTVYAVAAAGCGVDPAYDCTTRGIACGDDGGTKLDAVAPDATGPSWTCCDASGDSNGGSEGAADAAPTCSDAASFCSATGKCVDTSSDPANCGACGKPCSPVPNGTVLCQAGACVVGSCTSNFNECGGLCVREDDPDHCGVSCTKCAGPPSGHGSASCTSGSCGVSCAATYFSCNGDCHSPSADPSDSCVVTEAVAVFVAPHGQDASTNGTRTAPFATIGYAAQHATNHVRIYVQAGTYAGAVSFDASTPALAIFGGFDSAWHYDPAHQQVKIQTSAGVVPLSIKSVTSALQLESLEFDAADATAPGGSSIAAVFAGSPNVSLHNVTLKAGAGMKGDDGTLAALTYPSANDLRGANANGNAGGLGCSLTCPGGLATSGGAGGNGGAPAGSDGLSGTPNLGGTSGIGQTAAHCVAGDGTKLAGASASVASPGAAATTLGSLANGQWTPSSGGKGASGGPGQGGGGGGGSASGGGGGGGCGGCGGAGATGGGGGGASIALLVLDSVASVTIDSCTLVAAKAGAGGNGVAGQVGQTPGGARGTGDGVGCNGGSGGAGGNGGAGGGGAGGISVGVLYQGTLPTLKSTTPIVSSTAATGGLGGSASNSGIPGVSKATMSL